jgi:predicted ATPase with chaperone activity
LPEPDAVGRELLLRATERMHLNTRGYYRILRVARTIADFDGAAQIRRAHCGGPVLPHRARASLIVAPQIAPADRGSGRR